MAGGCPKATAWYENWYDNLMDALPQCKDKNSEEYKVRMPESHALARTSQRTVQAWYTKLVDACGFSDKDSEEYQVRMPGSHAYITAYTRAHIASLYPCTSQCTVQVWYTKLVGACGFMDKDSVEYQVSMPGSHAYITAYTLAHIASLYPCTSQCTVQVWYKKLVDACGFSDKDSEEYQVSMPGSHAYITAQRPLITTLARQLCRHGTRN
jgi:hypothetical protein